MEHRCPVAALGVFFSMRVNNKDFGKTRQNNDFFLVILAKRIPSWQNEYRVINS
jgi:hypothetical protein